MLCFTVSGSVEEKLSDRITLDVHFRLATMVRYRTGLVYDWMDLLGKWMFSNYCIYLSMKNYN